MTYTVTNLATGETKIVNAIAELPIHALQINGTRIGFGYVSDDVLHIHNESVTFLPPKNHSRGQCCQEFKDQVLMGEINHYDDGRFGIYGKPIFIEDNGEIDDLTEGAFIKYCPFCGRLL